MANPPQNRRDNGFVVEAVGLVLLALLTSFLHLWNLAQNGWGNLYYAASVRSMRDSFHNFLFATYDPAGFVSVDKPPVALWIQTLSSFIFGFNSFGLLLPEVIAGIASVLLLYSMVRRQFGKVAGFLAATCFALTPITLAVDRMNLPDSLLTFCLICSAYAILRSFEKENALWLLLGAVFLGIGFNIKMWQALLLAPAFGVIYLLFSEQTLNRRFLILLSCSIVVLTTSFVWILFVDSTPTANRPFIGGSRNNSAVDLILVYNGWERIKGGKDQLTPSLMEPGAPLAALGTAAGFSAGKPGMLRLINRQLGLQVMWWAGLAFIGILLSTLTWSTQSKNQRAAICLWSGWFLVFAVVFSVAGGTVHAYYVSVLAPPISALAGIGMALLWHRRRQMPPWVFLSAFIFSSLWQLLLLREYLSVYPILGIGAGIGVLAGLGTLWRRGTVPFTGLGLVGLALCPLYWCWTVVAVPGNGLVPSAGPEVAAGGWQFPPPQMPESFTQHLSDFLVKQQKGERFLLATGGVYNASPIIIRTGKPVMAMGGFLGSDPILTPNSLANYVARGELRFVLVSPNDGLPGNTYLGPLFDWTKDSCRPVDPQFWMEYQPGFGMEVLTLYDCLK